MENQPHTPKKGDKISLQSQEAKVIECENCSHLMVNFDKDQLKPGDLQNLKRLKIRISNPETTEPICLNCEFETWGSRLNRWFENDDNDDDDDSNFFSGSSGVSLGSLFGGSSFGGFGGGTFSGGGASRSW